MPGVWIAPHAVHGDCDALRGLTLPLSQGLGVALHHPIEAVQAHIRAQRRGHQLHTDDTSDGESATGSRGGGEHEECMFALNRKSAWALSCT